MKKRMTKLRLTKETLALLTETDARRAMGGTFGTYDGNCESDELMMEPPGTWCRSGADVCR